MKKMKIMNINLVFSFHENRNVIISKVIVIVKVIVKVFFWENLVNYVK